MITHTIPLAKAPKAALASMRADPMTYFTERGVQFSPRASCSFEDAGMTLVVTDTLYGIDLVHEVLESLVSQESLKKSK